MKGVGVAWAGGNYNTGSSGGFGQFNGNNNSPSNSSNNGSGRVDSKRQARQKSPFLKDQMSQDNHSVASCLRAGCDAL